MARQTSNKKLKFKLAANHIEYLSKSQAEWYTAKATRSTAQFVRKRRRRIVSMLEETSGEAPDPTMKASIEEAVAAWFKANCRPRNKAAKIGTKARSGREVFAHMEWKEVARKKRELMDAAQFEGDQHIGFYQRAVTELWDKLPEEQKARYANEAVEWDNIAPPGEIQLINAESVSRRTWLFAEDIYRQANARMWAMVAFRDKDGVLVKQIVDHNDRLDGGTRLDEEFKGDYEKMHFEKLFDRWMRPYYSTQEGQGPAQPPKNVRELARVELERNQYGEPILPDVNQCPPGEPSHRKWITKVFRAFIFDSYRVASGGVKSDISWARLFANLRRFVDESFWPDRLTVDLKDPSVMRYDNLKAILGFWYSRQLAGADPVFSFSHYEDPKNEGTWLERVARIPIDTDLPSKQEKSKRGKGQGEGRNPEARAGRPAAPFAAAPFAGGSRPVAPNWSDSPLKRIGTAVVESSGQETEGEGMGDDNSETEGDEGKGGRVQKALGQPKGRTKGKVKGKERAKATGGNDSNGGSDSEGDREAKEATVDQTPDSSAGEEERTPAKSTKKSKGKKGKGKSGVDDDDPSAGEEEPTHAKSKRKGKNRKGKGKADADDDSSAGEEERTHAKSKDDDPSAREEERTHAKSKKNSKGRGKTVHADDESRGPEDSGEEQPVQKRNMPTLSAGVTTRAKAKSSEIQTRSKTKLKGIKPRPAGVRNGGDIFDLKDRRPKGKNY
ncbi:hypothetical protein CC1G_02072 [Coprinopsis cinerea okayama7|uniref:Uncharacterized protein n=1 Tax=Coprinopsis cinerea (strain Okayama-7 / 130 / ATCC MYA-4618 / FGSC 9003) TaxID=240176 RepID=A8NK30_COPC7|nr:hypothetical protein CC1G_02072 [Coprinopsis cinerea okayama7\|eukprot:XP_001834336.1 hypothetical protein CC1G_02072 [Coprinopsis cinerea okayama7\